MEIGGTMLKKISDSYVQTAILSAQLTQGLTEGMAERIAQ